MAIFTLVDGRFLRTRAKRIGRRAPETPLTFERTLDVATAICA
jgi:hypothetical protein